MRTVSADFKTAIKTAGRQLKAYITDSVDEITEADDLQSFSIVAEGSLCRTVMRQASAVYCGNHSYLDDYVNLGVGVVLPSTSTEYLDYGAFKVVEVTQDVASGITTAKLYDRMYEALQKYELEPSYPITTFELVESICTELGWTLAVTSFPNDDISITSDIFENSDFNYRDVLNMIAEASGSIILFDEDDELTFKQVSGTVLETLTSSNLMSLKLEPVYGELNSVVLSRSPQEDNIAETNDASVTTYGLNEFKIVNNLIVDSDRETYITPIYDELEGIMYYPFEADTEGLGYFEIGDRIKVTDLASTEYEVLIMEMSIRVAGGLIETIKAKAPEKSVTDYDYAGIIGKTIKNTQIIVNKQEGEIEILNSEMETVISIPRQSTAPTSPELNDLWIDTDDDIMYIWDGSTWNATGLTTEDLTNYYTKDETLTEISTTADSINASVIATQTSASTAQALAEENSEDITAVQSQVADLELTSEDLTLKIEETGGTNLLKNSTGLKGSLEEWQEYTDGVLDDEDNDGTIVQTSNVEENTESGSAIRIDEQFIIQTLSTIIGETYTLYFRFNKLGDLDLTITGVIGDIEVTAGDYVDETWAVFKYEFTASSINTVIVLSNVSSGVGSYAIISDAICRMGYLNGWEQAPNEVYGNGYRFDKDGLTITSLESQFKAVLDNVKLGIYDTSSGTDRIMALFSTSAGLITSLVAQDELVLQRYENSDKSTRFIPTSTGCMITVND